MGLEFYKVALAVEQNNYATKVINTYIVSDLDAWHRSPTNNFKLRNYLFGTKLFGKKQRYERVYV